MQRLALSVFLGLFLCIATSFGQATDATLVGAVNDATGAAVPNAAIAIENVATGIKLNTTTNNNGELGGY